MKRLALSLLASPLIAATLSAQDINGSLFGYLADPRGLPVAGATVTLRNINTDARRSAQADERGAFEFLSVTPGSYDLVAEQSGFKKLVSSGHEISPTERLSVGTIDARAGRGETNRSWFRAGSRRSRPSAPSAARASAAINWKTCSSCRAIRWSSWSECRVSRAARLPPSRRRIPRRCGCSRWAA